MIQLSKSEYMLYLKHPAWLWLKKHDKSKLPQVDAATQAIFDAGHLFEEYAEVRFDNITQIGFNNYNEYLNMPQRTTSALQSGVGTIGQGRFVAAYDDAEITCIVDIVEVVQGKELDLYEIKSSTSVKPDHIEDLAFQTVVLEAAGYKVRNISVIYCNNSYVRRGELDKLAMSSQTDVTSRVRTKVGSAKNNISLALIVAQSQTMPDPTPRRTKMSGLREWLGIYESLRPQSEKYNIYKLCRASADQIGMLEDIGVSKIADIPDSFKLRSQQKSQLAATRQDSPVVNLEKIKKFMDKIVYPIYFLDYETLSSIVPPFDGLTPSQQLPFQYSLHIIKEPGADLIHKEFLHTLDTDPTPGVLEALKRDIGPQGTVLAWYDIFEKGRNELMAELQPEYKDFTNDLNGRMLDLMTPFAKGYYADKDFFGSASIKKVLPVIAPDLSYGDLDIQEGSSAQRLWMQSVYENVHSPIDKAKIMDDLRKYCELDTYAMVRIYEFLAALCKGQSSSDPSEQLSLL